MPDTINISPALASCISAVTLSGWSADNTDAGALYARASIAGSTLTLTLYKHADMQSADAVASGSASVGASATPLTQSNASGLSGSAELAESNECEGLLRVSFAFESDLAERLADLDALLDDQDQFAGGERFEIPFNAAKREIDRIIRARLRRAGMSRATRASVLATISPSSELRNAQACLALAKIFERLSSDVADVYQQRANAWSSRYRDALATAEISFNATGGSSFSMSISIGDYAFLLG